ncbi:MAG: hypothetical protein BIFFINMI_02342 [Phycisphaerae bacterium]|nr:hypothetical protein [Phycisphaerae bacterium]
MVTRQEIDGWAGFAAWWKVGGMLAAALLVGGCRMPEASLKLLAGIDTALADAQAGNTAIREAARVQLSAQQVALDAAFEADIRRLPGDGDGAAASLSRDDVLAAKALYDKRSAEIDASRAANEEAFSRIDRDLAVSRQMADMVRRLVLQQQLLAGQGELAVNALLAQSAAAKAAP